MSRLLRRARRRWRLRKILFAGPGFAIYADGRAVFEADWLVI